MYEEYERKSKLKYILVLIILAGLIAYGVYANGTRSHLNGLTEPIQTECEGGTEFTLRGYDVKIDYLYEYDATALVVHTKDYPGMSLERRLSPKDVALAWGSVAAYNETIDFHWKQRGRWVYWNTNTYEELKPIGDVSDVDSQSSNNHLVPADVNVRRQIAKIRRGDVVRIRGYLVNINAKSSNGAYFNWKSSTKRTDSGDGACELIYVTAVDWVE